MFTVQIDLGQVIISGLIAIVGYLINRQIAQYDKRLERLEELIFNKFGLLRK
jgi:preprotein translocase subunit SecF